MRREREGRGEETGLTIEKTSTIPLAIAELNCIMPPSFLNVLSLSPNTAFWSAQYLSLIELYAANPAIFDFGFAYTFPPCL